MGTTFIFKSIDRFYLVDLFLNIWVELNTILFVSPPTFKIYLMLFFNIMALLIPKLYKLFKCLEYWIPLVRIFLVFSIFLCEKEDIAI